MWTLKGPRQQDHQSNGVIKLAFKKALSHDNTALQMGLRSLRKAWVMWTERVSSCKTPSWKQSASPAPGTGPGCTLILEIRSGSVTPFFIAMIRHPPKATGLGVVLAHSWHSPFWWWGHCYRTEVTDWIACRTARNPAGSATGWQSSPAPQRAISSSKDPPPNISKLPKHCHQLVNKYPKNTWGCGEHSAFKRHWLPNSEKHVSVIYKLPSLWYSSNINGLIHRRLTTAYFVSFIVS